MCRGQLVRPESVGLAASLWGGPQMLISQSLTYAITYITNGRPTVEHVKGHNNAIDRLIEIRGMIRNTDNRTAVITLA